MKYYYKPENRIIETEELVRKYGSRLPITQLGMYELTIQPNYAPVGFNEIDDKYYPVESYENMKSKAIAALVAAGLTEEEAMAALTGPVEP